MQLRHPPGDGQAQTSATRTVGAEALEDTLPVGRQHSGTGVEDVQPPARVTGPGRDPDGHLGRAVPSGVVEGVDQELAQPRGIGADGEVGGDAHVVGRGASGRSHLRHTVVDEGPQGDRLPVELDDARREARELEQVAHQGSEPLRLHECLTEVSGVRRDDTVSEVLQEGDHCGEGRA